MKAFEEESNIQAELQECCRVEVWMRDRLESMAFKALRDNMC